MKLINVKNETAVTRVISHVRMFEMYFSCTHAAIRDDMSPMDALNMITLKKWSVKRKGAFHFDLMFHLPVKRGMALWRAECTLNEDYYSISVDNVSFQLTRLVLPELFDVAVNCEFGFVAFCAVPTSFSMCNLLQGAFDQKEVLFKDMCDAHELAEKRANRIVELEQELEDLKQQLADIYWSTQN